MLSGFTSNYFELFGLPDTFELDGQKLAEAYKQLQSQVHPDKFTHLSEVEQRVAMQWSTRINEAYQTLKAPLSRAIYLLDLQGIQALAPEQTQLPPMFLMQQIEWRESLYAAQQKKNLPALQIVEGEINTTAQSLLEQLTVELDVKKDNVAAAKSVRQLKFIDRIREEINDIYTIIEA